MDPERIDEAFDQAERLRGDGQLVSALSLYRAVIAAWPEYAPAHAGAALCHVNLGDFEEATSRLKEATRLDPGNVEYRLAFGKLLAMLGRYDEARRYFRGPGDEQEDRP